MDAYLNGIALHVLQDDITNLAVDALIISTTSSPRLEPSAYPDRELLAKGGAGLAETVQNVGLLEVGQVSLIATPQLASPNLILCASPQISNDNARGKLASSVWRALRLAEERGFGRIAFYPLSVGRFGYPIEGCADVMAGRIVDFTFEEIKHLKMMSVCVDQATFYQIFVAAFRREIDAAQDEVGAAR